ncbi:MAG: DUF255 domain-containing protein [Granulosicoccus sp.]
MYAVNLICQTVKKVLFLAFCFSFIVSMQAQAAETPEGQVVAPGTSDEVQAGLLARLRSLGDDYVPRTEHFLENGEPEYINRLIAEDSPYLLQHAHNPVNWYPWGEEAFSAAKAQEKPIFLSIGYATCHWCHVMERESFEDKAIAALMNKYFIAIKVDREQLPDVDALFMTAVTMMTGSGGWPMSSFLDSSGRPFYGGTYFPPQQFTELLDRVSTVWATEQDALLEQADIVAKALREANQLSSKVQDVGEAEIKRASAMAVSQFDEEYGGFGRAPKFPQESTLLFLLEQARRTGAEKVLEVVDITLDKMAAGGIHDQIGGGFHRYSVDNQWQVPHFEKMLYNQAGLARAYTLGWLLTGKRDHADTAKGILDYVLREMSTDDGVFYSATDADSEGREGIYFIWDAEALAGALEPADAELAAKIWGVDGFANFEDQTVLHRPDTLEQLAEQLEFSVDELRKKKSVLAALLRSARAKREPPLRDDKILTGWNGFMITAFAEAAIAFDDAAYLEAAQTAANQLWSTAMMEDGTLKRSQFNGVVSIEAKQVDYAWLAEAMLAVYDADGDPLWLERARLLTDSMIKQFRDAEGGGFFMGAPVVSGADLVTRPKDLYDASTPSGNSIALRVLTRLYRRTGEAHYAEEADQLIGAFSSALAKQTGGFYYLLTGLAEHLDVETGPTQYAARGVVRASARLLGDEQLEISIDLKEGWHINAPEPLQDYLIPTSIADQQQQPLQGVEFPVPVMRKLGFQSETLSLYEGQVTLRAGMPANTSGSPLVPVKLTLQACSDEICLAPETLTLRVSTLDASDG